MQTFCGVSQEMCLRREWYILMANFVIMVLQLHITYVCCLNSRSKTLVFFVLYALVVSAPISLIYIPKKQYVSIELVLRLRCI